MRKLIFWIATAIVFVAPNVMIWNKERLRSSNHTVLLELAPVDPRSLIQGDYMILDYTVARKLDALKPQPPKDGLLVLKLDKNRIGKFVRIHKANEKLSKDELLMRYRFRQRRWRIGANAFFFQEGHAKHYNSARYGEYRVTPSGDSVLVGLRDKDRKPIKPPKTKPKKRRPTLQRPILQAPPQKPNATQPAQPPRATSKQPNAPRPEQRKPTTAP